MPTLQPSKKHLNRSQIVRNWFNSLYIRLGLILLTIIGVGLCIGFTSPAVYRQFHSSAFENAYNAYYQPSGIIDVQVDLKSGDYQSQFKITDVVNGINQEVAALFSTPEFAGSQYSAKSCNVEWIGNNTVQIKGPLPLLQQFTTISTFLQTQSIAITDQSGNAIVCNYSQADCGDDYGKTFDFGMFSTASSSQNSDKYWKNGPVSSSAAGLYLNNLSIVNATRFQHFTHSFYDQMLTSTTDQHAYIFFWLNQTPTQIAADIQQLPAGQQDAFHLSFANAGSTDFQLAHPFSTMGLYNRATAASDLTTNYNINNYINPNTGLKQGLFGIYSLDRNDSTFTNGVQNASVINWTLDSAASPGGMHNHWSYAWESNADATLVATPFSIGLKIYSEAMAAYHSIDAAIGSPSIFYIQLAIIGAMVAAIVAYFIYRYRWLGFLISLILGVFAWSAIACFTLLGGIVQPTSVIMFASSLIIFWFFFEYYIRQLRLAIQVDSWNNLKKRKSLHWLVFVAFLMLAFLTYVTLYFFLNFYSTTYQGVLFLWLVLFVIGIILIAWFFIFVIDTIIRSKYQHLIQANLDPKNFKKALKPPLSSEPNSNQRKPSN